MRAPIVNKSCKWWEKLQVIGFEFIVDRYHALFAAVVARDAPDKIRAYLLVTSFFFNCEILGEDRWNSKIPLSYCGLERHIACIGRTL